VVKERGILFSAPMVRALLDGRKTVTRRIVDPKKLRVRVKHLVTSDFSDFLPVAKAPPGVYPAGMNQHGAVWVHALGGMLGLKPDEFSWVSPYGEPGDRLWVRETWAPQPGREESIDLPEYEGGGNPDAVCFRADERKPGEDPKWIEGLTHGVQKWRPSIFMPRWASRITLEVVSARVERLLAIDEEDAIREGVRPFFETLPSIGREQCLTTGERATDAEHRAGFALLWDELNGDRANWKSNPWVWRVAFRRVTQGGARHVG
jgi:hypothetical protein